MSDVSEQPRTTDPNDVGVARVVIERSGPERPWLGQLVRFDVQVWRPSLDAAPLPPFEFDELNTPGAIAHFRQEAPPPDLVHQGDEDYLVQHRTLVVFPQRDGHLTLAPVVARWTDDDEAKTAQSAALELDAATPPRADERLVVSPAVQIHASTNQPLHGLRVGDGFVRTVTVSATDSDPLVLPTIDFRAVSGLSLYPEAPKDASSAERGQLSASRTFQATYVVERVGHYELDAVTLRWLEPASGEFHETSAPALSFWARPNLGLGLSMWGTTPWAGAVGFGLCLILALFVVWLARRRRKGPLAVEKWFAQRTAERRAFLLAAKRTSGPALPFLRALYAWLQVRYPSRTERTLTPLRSLDSDMAESLALTERSAFGAGLKPVDPANRVPKMLLIRARRRFAASRDQVVFDSRSLNGPRLRKGTS